MCSPTYIGAFGEGVLWICRLLQGCHHLPTRNSFYIHISDLHTVQIFMGIVPYRNLQATWLCRNAAFLVAFTGLCTFIILILNSSTGINISPSTNNKIAGGTQLDLHACMYTHMHIHIHTTIQFNNTEITLGIF